MRATIYLMYNNIENYDYSYLAGGPFGVATPRSVLVEYDYGVFILFVV
jgi:hypothetical protein